MRVLITGSRTWTDTTAVIRAIKDAARGHRYADVVVVHGDANGADRVAGATAKALNMQVEVHPADWERYGKRAGFLRNDAMVNQGADVCLAFIKDASKGATMCADIAEAAGIPTKRFTA